jgi:hypothetical protein
MEENVSSIFHLQKEHYFPKLKLMNIVFIWRKKEASHSTFANFVTLGISL